MSTLSILRSILVLAVLSLLPVSQAETREFPGGAVVIVDNSVASPYPAFAIVSGVNSRVTGIRVKMNFFHTYPDDVDVFLIAPDGSYAVVFSDAGGGVGALVDLVFDDAAPTAIPDTTQLFSGTYRTANYEPVEPALTAVFRTNLTSLAAGGVNGVWSLFVSDDASTDSGFIPSWSMLIDTLPGDMTTGRISHTATLLPDGNVLVAGGANGPSSLSSSEVFDPTSGTWTLTGPLSTGRSLHTATLLPNGKVLVTGGTLDSSTYLSSAELYDPASGTWSNTASMSTARHNHSATLLSDGRVLVAGGRLNGGSGGSSYLSSAEIYDPASGTWTGTASMGTTRDTHSATRLVNGNVLVAGGASPPTYNLSSAELFNPAGNAGVGSWSAAASLPAPSYAHTATLLRNGRVLVAGGSNGSGSLTNAVQYNVDLDSWSSTAGLLVARGFHTATLMPNGFVIVAGGSGSSTNVATYVPGNAAWTTLSGLGVGRKNHAATLLADGRVLITGGEDVNGSAISSTELRDGSNPGLWNPTALPLTSRTMHTATLLPNGKTLIVGGTGSSASPELYNAAANSWSATGALGTQRNRHTATLLPNGKVLAVGGVGGSGGHATTELYDPALNAWSSAAPLATGRYDHTSTLLPNGNILVVGGFSGAIALNSAELYDPADNSWSSAGDSGDERYAHSATLLPNGKVLVAGGYDGSSYAAFNRLYDPASNSWAAAGVFLGQRQTATLMPNGTVLFAGGELGGAMTNVIVYHPTSGTWSNIVGLVSATHSHEATLLPNGRVLVAGGTSSSTNAQIYDPSLDSWTLTASMAYARTNHTATLLPNGKVLVVGGVNGFPPAELYYGGLGAIPGTEPQIVSSCINGDDQLELTGTGFRGLSGASGGNGAQDSSSDYPLVQWRQLDNEQTYFLLPDMNSQFSATNVTSSTFAPLSGYGMVTVFVNGIPSTSFILSAAGVPYISAVLRSSANVLLTYAGLQGGLTYVEEQTLNLRTGPWTTNSVITAPSESMVMTNAITSSSTFWRLKRTP